MALWGDDRGAAVQVGVAILLAFLVLAITTYQVEVVPNQNAEIEFDHNQEVQNHLQELRGDIVGVSDGNSGGTQPVQLGTTYPARTIFVNPPAPSGSLETFEPGDGTIEIEGATVTDSAAPGTADYWDGTARSASTAGIQYEPRYNEFRGAPERTIYEHSFLYNEHDDAVIDVADQLLVEDDEITLVALDGDLDEASRQSVSVRTRALSRTANTVTVEPDNDEMTLTIPTDQPDFWAEELPDDIDTTVGTNEVAIELDESYDLRMAQVGVGDVTRDDPNDRAEYIVEIDDQAPTVVAEVRDQFNNPVRNVDDFEVENGEPRQDVTDSDGRLDIEPDPGANSVTVNINGTSGPDFETVTINVQRGEGGVSAGQLSAPGDATVFDGDGSPEPAGFEFQVQNDGSSDVQLTDVRIIPEDPSINGISDQVPGDGPGAAELFVESDTTGESGSKNILLATDDEYAFIPRDGIQFTLDERPPDEIYSTESEAFLETAGNPDFPFDTEFTGTQVELSESESATLTLAEFYELDIGGSDADPRDVTGERFSVTVGYLADGQRLTDQFVTMVQERGFQVEITDTNSPVTEGDPLTVDATIENAGDEDDTQTVELEVDGEQEDSESITLDAGESTSETFTWQTSSGDAGSDIPVTVLSEDDSDSTTVDVQEDVGAGISGTRVTDIVPNANDQMQTFTFELTDEELPEDDAVTITLEDAPSDEVLNWGGSLVDDEGEDGSVSFDSADDFTITYGDGETIPAGTTVQIRAIDIEVGDEDSQDDPYEFTFERSDSGASETDTFEVDGDVGDPDLNIVEVETVTGTDQQEQEITFEPTTDMDPVNNDGDEDEVLVIDLTDGNENDMYDGISATADTGTAEVGEDGGQVWVKYTADGGVNAGEEVMITLNDVDPTGGDIDETYNPGFSRGVADTVSESFNVDPPLEYTDDGEPETSDGGGSNAATVLFELQNNLDDQLTITDIEIDVTGSADRLDNGDPEINIETSVQDGDRNDDSSISINDPIELDQNAILASEGTADVTLDRFEEPPGQGPDWVDMSGEDITVTLFFDERDPHTLETKTID